MRRNRLRTGLFLIVWAAAAILAVAAYLAPSWHAIRDYVQSSADLERKTIDSRFSIRGKEKPPANVVLVAIDDQSFNDLQFNWPFPRAYHAGVINRLHKDGAKVILYDVQFTEPSPFGANDDDKLILACRAARTCVMGTTEVNASSKGEKTEVFGGRQGQKIARTTVAWTQVPNDPDGVRRKMAYGTSGVKSFAVAGYELATRHKVKPSALGGKKAYIDYAGPPGTFPTVSFSQVCACAEKGRALRRIKQLPPGYFKDKVVIVGAKAQSLQDVHPTPYGNDNLMAGPEIHANAYRTVAEGFPLKDTPAWFDALLIVLLALVGPLASIWLRLWGVGLAVLVGVLYAVATQLAFDHGWIVSFTYPIGALLLATVGSIAVHYVTEAFERERVRGMFSRFVPESVVGEVLAQADGARLGGVSRYATVMFSDLRGFTSFAEQLEPDQVIRILNRYLTAMVDDAIIPAGGTLVDYMGDGIMAVFGAPIEMADHADRALAAARAKLRELEKFNLWVKAEFGFEKTFRMGIGLNSGQVMSGNVGSERRLAYTAIGDTTNTAARLEGMTKSTDYMLFMAESTKSALTTEPDDLVHVGMYEIRGRVEKLSIWSAAEAHKEREGESFASVAQGETLADK
ncbi:MAG: CHASE2 domain-containing protein [Thermoleophilaceae bacterium]